MNEKVFKEIKLIAPMNKKKNIITFTINKYSIYNLSDLFILNNNKIRIAFYLI